MAMFRCVLTFIIWVIFSAVWIAIPWQAFIKDNSITQIIIIVGLIGNFILAVWLAKNTVDWTL